MQRTRYSSAALASALVVGGALAAFATPAGATPVTEVFTAPVPSATQTWTVPAGVTEATFSAQGAAGGAGASAAGGLGGQVRATLPVTAGQVYAINVGSVGAPSTDGGAGGTNGGGAGTGGAGSASAGGGGAATDVRPQNAPAAGRLIVAAGGGGGGGNATTGTSTGGAGGAALANGTAGLLGLLGGGGGLSTGAGGAAGTGGVAGIAGFSPDAVNAGFGGDGGTGGPAGSGSGGGGGGGWSGGGGGGTGGDDPTNPGGGGGGAGGQNVITTTAVTGSTSQGTATGTQGNVTITYDATALPTVQSAPTLTGVVAVSQTLTCNTGTWANQTGFSYTWQRNGATIAGITNPTYVLTDADVGQRVSCTVTATNANGSATARTPEVIVPISGPVNSVLPRVTGTAALGSRVTCDPGTWSQAPQFAFQWLRDGVAINGQTANTYTESKNDAGHAIQCAVRATAGGASVVAQTAAVGGPARLVIMVATALVSKTGAVTVPIACYGPTNCVVPAITATSGGQVIARGTSRTVHSGNSSKVSFRLGKRGLAHLGKAGSSIKVRFVSTPTGGYGGNRAITFVALHGAKL